MQKGFSKFIYGIVAMHLGELILLVKIEQSNGDTQKKASSMQDDREV